MRVLIFLLFVGWMFGNLLAILFLRRLPKFTALLFGVVFAAISFGSFVGGLYIMGEFVINKGPDDWGAMWHAGYPLKAKFGTSEESSYEERAFEKDIDGSKSGTYLVHFRYANHTGIVKSHYNMATHKFDHDEIIDDK